MIHRARITRRRLFLGLACGAAQIVPYQALSRPKPGNVQSSGASPWLTLPSTPSLPAASRQGLLNANGTPIFFAQFGRGPHVLLLHGGLANSAYWGNQIEELSNDFLVTVVDTRGHGRSPVASNQFSYSLFAKDIVEVLRQLGVSKTAVIGWSDGAITGIMLALTVPDLLTALFAFGANTTLSGLKAGGARTHVFSMYLARCQSEYQALSPRPERWSSLQTGMSSMWKSEPNLSKQMLGRIKTPTAVVDGQYDEIIKPEHTREIAENIPHAELSTLTETSHFALLQDPTQFNAQMLRFLFERL